MSEVYEKKAIIMDDNLKTLGDSLCNHILETATLPVYNLVYVGKMKPVDTSEIPKDLQQFSFLEFEWAYSFIDINSANIVTHKELQEIDFENNLDSLINYDSGFRACTEFIFPLLECIRKHYESNEVVHYNKEINNETRVYIKIS